MCFMNFRKEIEKTLFVQTIVACLQTAFPNAIDFANMCSNSLAEGNIAFEENFTTRMLFTTSLRAGLQGKEFRIVGHSGGRKYVRLDRSLIILSSFWPLDMVNAELSYGCAE